MNENQKTRYFIHKLYHEKFIPTLILTEVDLKSNTLITGICDTKTITLILNRDYCEIKAEGSNFYIITRNARWKIESFKIPGDITPLKRMLYFRLFEKREREQTINI